MYVNVFCSIVAELRMSEHAVLGMLGQKKWRKFLVESLEMDHARRTVGEVSGFQTIVRVHGSR